MADIGTSVRAYLLTKTAVTSLVSTRIYTDVLPQNEVLPAVTYMLLPTTHEHQLSGFAGVAHARVQLTAYATTRASANAICEAIRTCGIIGYRGTSSGVYLNGCEFDGPWYDIENSQEDTDDHRYLTIIELQVHYTEST